MGTPLLRVKDENGVWHDVEAIRGLSAYQLAVKNGYTGTEEQWLASITGVEGKSAYQVAKEEGFEGTKTEWLASLKGDKGDAGTKGDTGNDGKSAYQLAVDGGFEGTEAEWLESLKATGSTVVSLTILANTWGATVTITDEHITATNNVVMIPGASITDTQLDALQRANCQDCGIQTAGSITFKVFGTVPSIDIPVRLIIGGGM